MELDWSLRYSKQPATCSYPRPHESSTSFHLISWKPIFVLHSHLALGLRSGYFPFLMSFQSICPSPRLSSTLFGILYLYGDGLSPPRPTPKQGKHPLSAVGDYLIHSQVLSTSGGRLLYLQPHEASCGDKNPLFADSCSLIAVKSIAKSKWLHKWIWTRRDSSDNGGCFFPCRPVSQGYPHVRECNLTMVRRPASSQFVPRDRSKPRVLSYLFPRNSVLPTNQVNCRDPTCLRVAVQGTNHVREGALRSRK